MEEDSDIRIQIIKVQIIKPSSPTPHEKRVLKLSLIDQTYSSSYGPFIFFNTNHSNKLNEHFADLLAKSLSQTLTLFYPFAGRLNGDVSVECNDEGAHFVEAGIGCTLSDLLQRPDAKLIKKLLPNPDPKSALLLVQLTVFSCGGFSVGLSVSHKLADAASLSYFLRVWSSVSAGKKDEDLPLPEFIGTLLFPPPDLPIRRTLPIRRRGELVSRRFVFTASALTKLKAKTIGTSVEVVTALLFKAVSFGDQSFSGVIRQHVNLRSRITPGLPENASGNILWSFLVSGEGREMEIGEIVAKTRKAQAEFLSEKADKLRDRSAGFAEVSEFLKTEAELSERGIDMCCFTSLRKLGLYEVDFGRGKPVWVTSPLFNDNMFVLMDTRCGRGIEAWVTLEESRMEKFEAGEELLEFASVNPPVFNSGCRM